MILFPKHTLVLRVRTYKNSNRLQEISSYEREENNFFCLISLLLYVSFKAETREKTLKTQVSLTRNVKVIFFFFLSQRIQRVNSLKNVILNYMYNIELIPTHVVHR